MTLTTAPDIQGFVAPGFEPVREAFARLFAEPRERGAGLAATLDGRVIVDLTAGWADRGRTIPFDARTLTPVYSCSKAVSALVVAGLVDAGALDYEQPLADLWPAFAAHGKARVTLGDALSHQAGLPGLEAPWDAEAWFDRARTLDRLAAAPPMWPPGSGSGYHPTTWGYLIDQAVERATGRRVGAVLAEHHAQPHGLDLWIGLPDAEHSRVAELDRPRAMADFGVVDDIKRAAFLSPWSALSPRDLSAWRRFDLASVTGHATALALARFMEPWAREGRRGEARPLSAGAIARASAIRVSGPDRVLPLDSAFAAGLFRADERRRVYGPGARTVGHTGFGGSAVWADPDRALSAAYVMTAQNPTLFGGKRAEALAQALYACL